MWIDGADVLVSRSTISAIRGNFSTVRLLSGSLTIDRSTFTDNTHKESSSQSLGFELDAVGGSVRVTARRPWAAPSPTTSGSSAMPSPAARSVVAGSMVSSTPATACSPVAVRRPQRRRRRLLRPHPGLRPAVGRRRCSARWPTTAVPRSPTCRHRRVPRSTPSRWVRPGCALWSARPTSVATPDPSVGGCDAGSVEIGTSAPLSLVVDSALDATDAVPG